MLRPGGRVALDALEGKRYAQHRADPRANGRQLLAERIDLALDRLECGPPLPQRGAVSQLGTLFVEDRDIQAVAREGAKLTEEVGRAFALRRPDLADLPYRS